MLSEVDMDDIDWFACILCRKNCDVFPRWPIPDDLRPTLLSVPRNGNCVEFLELSNGGQSKRPQRIQR